MLTIRNYVGRCTVPFSMHFLIYLTPHTHTLEAKKDINNAQVYISFSFIVITYIVECYVWIRKWK